MNDILRSQFLERSVDITYNTIIMNNEY